jgi:phosphate transport system substrate-binding protein
MTGTPGISRLPHCFRSRDTGTAEVVLLSIAFDLSRRVRSGWIALAAVLLLALLGSSASADEPVRVEGSPLVARAIAPAIPLIRERGIAVKLDSAIPASTAIINVGQGTADIALSARPMTTTERANFPTKRFSETPVAWQAVALIVPRDVWEGGVRAISREQAQRIYEAKLTNWKELGGPDRPIKFYNPAQGQGVWEMFVTWIYGDMRKAPLGENFEPVADASEARNMIEFIGGSLSLIPTSMADPKRGIYSLAVRGEKGETAEALPGAVRDRSYPVARPLFLIAGERPTGDVRKFIEFLRSPEGQVAVGKSGEFVPAVALVEGGESEGAGR